MLLAFVFFGGTILGVLGLSDSSLAIAGGLMEGNFKGERYNDTDVYKTIEGASYSLSVRPDPALEVYLDSVNAKIAAAQEKDGYLYTARTTDPKIPPPGIGPERWSWLHTSHELYNAGHMYEAAIAHFQAIRFKIANMATEVEADLIVMGTHGHTGLSHVFFGSVAEHVVRHSRIPVLTVRQNAR